MSMSSFFFSERFEADIESHKIFCSKNWKGFSNMSDEHIFFFRGWNINDNPLKGSLLNNTILKSKAVFLSEKIMDPKK